MFVSAIDPLIADALPFCSAMFVRRTQTRSTTNGERYFTHRLVRSERRAPACASVPSSIWCSHFSVRKPIGRCCELGAINCFSSQEALPACDIPHAVEREAHRIAAQLLAGQVSLLPDSAQQHDAGDGEREFHNVDVASLQLLRPALSRRRTPRPVGHAAGAVHPAADPAGSQRSAARCGGRLHHRPHGRSRLRTGHLSLAVPPQRPGRTARHRLRGHEHDAALPRLRRVGRPGNRRSSSICSAG